MTKVRNSLCMCFMEWSVERLESEFGALFDAARRA
jgi:hypothetical protein